MESSVVACIVGRTSIWLIRLVSSPSISATKSGTFTPAAHSIKSASMVSPLAVIKAFSTAFATLVSRRISAPNFVNSALTLSDTCSARAGTSLGPASSKVTRICSGVTRSRPYRAKSSLALKSSADNSTPVAPPPTITMFRILSGSSIRSRFSLMK